MIEWKNYLGNRLICKKEDFYVIIPNDGQNSMPLFCNVCDSIMRSKLDEESYEKFECCDSCATYWAYPRKDDWKSGWRPTPEEIKNKYVDVEQ
jgi:hypothetical protein